jgi:SAM-dependent methyltransferase
MNVIFPSSNPPQDAPVSTQQHEVLHVGCGAPGRDKLPIIFRDAAWRELRLDIDPAVEPDFIASTTDMSVIPTGAVNAVYASHNVEHLHPHEVPRALGEMRRVLKADGIALIKLPDLQEVARHVAEGRLEDPLYLSPMGPITALDILYGHRASLVEGNLFMAHHTGFTDATLARALIQAGFAAVMVHRDQPGYCLTAIAFCADPDAETVQHAQAAMLPPGDSAAVIYRGS